MALHASPSRSKLPVPVASFAIQDLNMIDALLQLGQEQEIPIGIEYIDAAAFRNRITLHVGNSTMGILLDTITHGQGYYWFKQGEVVIPRPKVTSVTRRAAQQSRWFEPLKLSLNR